MENEYNLSQQEFELIERYIQGELDGEELNLFKQRLDEDKGFKTNVDTLSLIINGVETQSLKEQLNEFHQSIDSNEDDIKHLSSKRTFLWRSLAIAALFVIAAGSYLWLGGNNNDKLYSRYFSPDPGLPTTMNTKASNYNFYEAMVDYKVGDYDKAIQKWSTQQEVKKDNDTLNYFIGVAHMANGNTTKAITYLGSISSPEFTFFNDANFYLGLAYLKGDMLDKAKNAFRKSDLKEAKDLLNKLN